MFIKANVSSLVFQKKYFLKMFYEMLYNNIHNDLLRGSGGGSHESSCGRMIYLSCMLSDYCM